MTSVTRAQELWSVCPQQRTPATIAFCLLKVTALLLPWFSFTYGLVTFVYLNSGTSLFPGFCLQTLFWTAFEDFCSDLCLPSFSWKHRSAFSMWEAATNTVDRAACCLVRYLKADELLFLRKWLTGIKEIKQLVVPSSHLSFTQHSLHPYLKYTLTNKHQTKSYPLPTQTLQRKCGQTLAGCFCSCSCAHASKDSLNWWRCLQGGVSARRG